MALTHSIVARRIKIENRRQTRYPGASAVVRASWIDIAGSLRMGQARLVDICERGLAMELPERPQPNTYIRFQCDKMNVYGTGAVRHCQSNGARFIVGVEFSAGLRWQPPRSIASAQTLEVPRASDKFEWNWLFDKPADAMVGMSASGND